MYLGRNDKETGLKKGEYYSIRVNQLNSGKVRVAFHASCSGYLKVEKVTYSGVDQYRSKFKETKYLRR